LIEKQEAKANKERRMEMTKLESTHTVETAAPKHAARPRLTVLIAAHNEEECIGATLDSILAQERHIDHIVVAADNCTDRTVEIAQSRQAAAGPSLIVYETVANTHKKPGALNQAWTLTRDCTDLFVCIDADTVLPSNAVGDWEAEFNRDDTLGGCSAKFTMLSTQEMIRLAEAGIVPASVGELPHLSFRERMWCRIQKAEFAKWTDTALTRKDRRTSVLAGTACMLRASALEEVVAHERMTWLDHYMAGAEGVTVESRPQGPWTYDSQVEDYYLTYQLRSFGWSCKVSADVRAYTGAMLSMRTLWAQRMKWQVGTVADLRAIGLNRQTRIDWWQQVLGMISAVIRVSWIALLILGVALTHHFQLMKFWWVFPLLFAICDVREVWRVPHRTWADVLTAAFIVPQELFAFMRAAWFTWSWMEVLTGRTRDRWALQIAAERG
jgi:cellulose synthase/poly-beta-1,6-N-acetylglucosamine synthase-like glycosyltransferase